MQCQICNKNEATIHLTEITDGLRSETHICESCALQEGIAVKSQMPINELLSNLLAVQPSEEDLLTKSDLSCPHCGFTMERFQKKALLGCPYDYEVFQKQLLPLIKRTQNGHIIHRGKVPSRAPKDTKKQVELIGLQKQLDEAVKSEDYERAAGLRDKIQKINPSD